MKRLIPLILGIITLLFVNISALNKEAQIKHGAVMFVDLAPADPRSLIQGDYMTLRYNLHFQGEERDYYDKNRQFKKLLSVELDQQSRIISSTIYNQQDLSPQQHLLWVKDPNHWSSMYPASNTYLFGEGLAHCYQRAKYAELRVTREGEALLYQLTDENLVPLSCELKDVVQDEQLSGIFN